MPDNCHAEVFEIVGVQAKQNVSVDRVLAKGGFILAQTEVPEWPVFAQTRRPYLSGVDGYC